MDGKVYLMELSPSPNNIFPKPASGLGATPENFKRIGPGIWEEMCQAQRDVQTGWTHTT